MTLERSKKPQCLRCYSISHMTSGRHDSVSTKDSSPDSPWATARAGPSRVISSTRVAYSITYRLMTRGLTVVSSRTGRYTPLSLTTEQQGGRRLKISSATTNKGSNWAIEGVTMAVPDLVAGLSTLPAAPCPSQKAGKPVPCDRMRNNSVDGTKRRRERERED